MKAGAAHHPEIIQRHDVLLSGIYTALADIRDALLTASDPLPRYTPLSLDFLTDAFSANLSE